MFIWYESPTDHGVIFQTVDGKLQLYWHGVYGIQFKGWFLGLINGSCSLEQPQTEVKYNGIEEKNLLRT